MTTTPLCFTIPGAPATTTEQHKGVRVSRKRVIFYTKAAIEKERRRVTHAIAPFRPKTPLTGPLYFRATILFPLTAALCTKHVDKLADLEWCTWKTTRPDADNTAKLIADVLTKSGFWEDDSQVCITLLAKGFAVVPRIDVCIAPLHPDGFGLLPDMLAVWEGSPKSSALPEVHAFGCADR